MQRDKKTVIAALFLCSVVFSVWFCLLKQDALGYHTRDFAFFAQTQAKLLDSDLTPRLSLNPDGHSFLGLRGTEGEKNIHQAIHFAPVKYVHTVLYALTDSLFLVYVFNSLIVFAPALYVGWFGCRQGGKEGWFYFLMALAYLAYPSVHHVAAYDLRHYIFLAPLFALAFLSVHFQRSFVERILLFNLLFFAREEALVLGCVVVFYAVASHEKQGLRSLFKTDVKWYLASYAFWFAAIVTYYYWTGYDQEEPLIEQSALPVLFLVVGVSGITALRMVSERYGIPGAKPWIGLVAALSGFGPLFYHGGIWRSVDVFSLLFYDRYFLYAVSAFVCVLAAWRALKIDAMRQTLIGGLALFIAVEALAHASTFPLPSNVTKGEKPLVDATREYLRKREHARIVRQAAQRLDPKRSVVLTDYKTHQAFYDFENVYVWERLPWYLVPGQNRFYPENRSVLRRLLQEEIQYLVIGDRWRDEVSDELRDLGLWGRVVKAERNAIFSVWRIERPAQ